MLLVAQNYKRLLAHWQDWQGAKKGFFITTSTLTRDALEYVPRSETKIVLINGEQLSQLMIDHNLGVTSVSSYEVKRIDSDYFGDE